MNQRPNAAQVESRKREINARYAKRARANRPPITMTTLRVSDLQRLFRHRYGLRLPDDEAGGEDLVLVFHQIAVGGIDVVSRCVDWARVWAPWMHRNAATDLARQIAENPIRYTARQLGEQVRLTDAERKALQIRTMRPIDVTDAELAERRKQADKDQKKQKRTQARAAKPAPTSQTEPWVKAGIHKSTHYRRLQAEAVRLQNATKSVGNDLESFIDDGNSRAMSLTKPWESEGLSRATWYRRQRASSSPSERILN